LVGKAPHLVGKAPHLVGKAHHLWLFYIVTLF